MKTFVANRRANVIPRSYGQIGKKQVPLGYALSSPLQAGPFYVRKRRIEFWSICSPSPAEVLTQEDHTAPIQTAPLQLHSEGGTLNGLRYAKRGQVHSGVAKHLFVARSVLRPGFPYIRPLNGDSGGESCLSAVESHIADVNALGGAVIAPPLHYKDGRAVMIRGVDIPPEEATKVYPDTDRPLPSPATRRSCRPALRLSRGGSSLWLVSPHANACGQAGTRRRHLP